MSAGDVAGGWEDLEIGTLEVAGGVGLRYRLSDAETANIRFDFGVSEDGGQFYIQFSEAF